MTRARKIVESGNVNMELADPATFGEGGFSSPAALLAWLEANKPPFEPVLTHGDFCLPNVFLQDWKLTGLLDQRRFPENLCNDTLLRPGRTHIFIANGFLFRLQGLHRIQSCFFFFFLLPVDPLLKGLIYL